MPVLYIKIETAFGVLIKQKKRGKDLWDVQNAEMKIAR